MNYPATAVLPQIFRVTVINEYNETKKLMMILTTCGLVVLSIITVN